MSNHIICTDLTKEFRKGEQVIRPLEKLSLTVPQGEFLALMGPSGSGKTTLLNMISGIDSPSSGSLVVAGQELAGMSPGQLTAWRAKHVGYIFQLYHLIPTLDALENVELPLMLHPMSRAERRKRAMQGLELVGLAERAHHRPGELSGGQEQRVAIARALVANPPLLVADEPTGDLDREAADAVLELLKTLAHKHGKTIVMVTHDPHAAAASDRVLRLEKGKLLTTTGA